MVVDLSLCRKYQNLDEIKSHAYESLFVDEWVSDLKNIYVWEKLPGVQKLFKEIFLNQNFFKN